MPRLGAWRVFGVAAALLAGGDGRAMAQASTVDAAISSRLGGGAAPEHFLFFSGFDLWRFGYAGYAGAQWAPASLNNDGFVARLFVSNGVELYDTGTKRLRTEIFRSSLLPGWRFKRGNLEIKIFAGLDLENHRLVPDVINARLRGTHLGARVAADLWWEPIPDMMLASSLSATTIGSAYNARAAAGWRVMDSFWAGPEISASADEFSQQYRLGAHLTGFKTAEVEWSAAAGYVRDSFNRDGVYGRIGVLLRQ